MDYSFNLYAMSANETILSPIANLVDIGFTFGLADWLN